MAERELIEKVFREGDGILRLIPTFVPRRFGKAGKRLRLHPDDYFSYGMKRGSITERWLSSTIAANNGPDAAPDEGLSYVAVAYESDEKFTLKEAVSCLEEKLVGSELMERFGGWPMYSKFFDNINPLFARVMATYNNFVSSFKASSLLSFAKTLSSEGRYFIEQKGKNTMSNSNPLAE